MDIDGLSDWNALDFSWLGAIHLRHDLLKCDNDGGLLVVWIVGVAVLAKDANRGYNNVILTSTRGERFGWFVSFLTIGVE